jgi:hypothetical protein
MYYKLWKGKCQTRFLIISLYSVCHRKTALNSVTLNFAVAVVGSCLFSYGQKQGELCRRDNDCETGLLCTEVAGDGRTCQPPTSNKKQYSKY